MSIFLSLGWFFKQNWRRYLACFACLVLVSLTELLPPWLIGRVVDDLQQNTLTEASAFATVAMIAASAVVVYVLRNGWRILLFGGAIKLGQILRLRLYHHLLNMAPEFYHRHKTGDLMAHATNDIKAIEATAAEGVLTLVDSLVAGSVVIGAMLWVCGWQLTLVALLPFPVLALLVSRYGGMMRQRFGEAQAAFSGLNNRVQEAVSGIRAVRAHHLSAIQQQRFVEQSQHTVTANMAVARVDALFDPTISVCVALSTVASLGFGAWRIDQGAMTVGELTTFSIYLGLLVWPMLAFGWLFNIVERGNASLKRLDHLFSQPEAVQNLGRAPLVEAIATIHIKTEGFSYPMAPNRALEHLNLTIHQGQFVGICGKTGSGKSTLLRLLLREFDSDAVKINVNGVDHRQLDLDELRRRFAYVSQTPFLFSSSIADNIAFAVPHATREEIERVAKLACIHDDIVRLADGYETQLGEKGVNLSGGQKQRLTIARALLLDAEILLFDDAFCSLDMKTEADILHNLQQQERQRTIVLITQRLTNLNRADQLLVMDAGRVTEQGDHATLMQAGGWYAKIYEQQSMAISRGVG